MNDALEITLGNRLPELARLNEALTEFGRRHELATKDLHDLTLALEEVVTNVIHHGYPDGGDHEITVRLRLQPGEVSAEVEDDGQPFNPLQAPAPDTTKPLAERTVGGLGIHLVRTLMDHIDYRRQDHRNVLTLGKRRRPS